MNFFSKIRKNLFSIFQITLVVLLVVLVIVFVGVLSFECVEKYTSKLLDLPGKNETLKFLGIGMGGVVVALQALMSYKRAKAMEKSAEAQADAAKAQADAVSKTEQGQRQDRLKNAIEHLGHEKDSVRLGGAYELFHLAEDTEDLRQTVFDILCAHIRRTTGESEYREAHESKPSEEVQSLLTLLFVQEHEVFKGCDINLQGSWLKWADLREARLEKAILVKAHMQGAWLDGVQLQASLLDGAQLQEARLDKAHMQGARFGGTQLQGVRLYNANMQGAWFGGTQLQGATLGGAQLQGAILDGARLQEAWLQGAHMQGIGIDFFPERSFEDRMREQINKKCDPPELAFEGGLSLQGVIFSGGLSQEDVDSLVEGISDEKATMLRRKLRSHIGQPESNQLMEKSSGAIIGSYTAEEAEKWIAEYKKAVPEIPEDDS